MANYYFGQGKVYVALRDAAGAPQGYTFLGNCPELTLTMSRASARFAKGGTEVQAALVPRGEGANSIRIVLDEYILSHLQNLVYGARNVVNSAPVIDEAVIARLGKIVPLNHMNITVAPVVKHTSGSPTYTEGTDYTANLEHGSLTFPSTGSAIAESQSLLVSYTYSDYNKLSGFTMKPGYHSIRMEGYNITNTPYTPVVLDVYKVRFRSVVELPLIGEDLASLQLDATMHYDSVQPDTTADGRYFRIRRYDPS